MIPHRFPNRGAVPPELGRGDLTTAGGSDSAWPPERKLRLFACGCCRQWWKGLAAVCRRAVVVAERYADGQCPVSELEAAWRSCRRAEGLGLPGGPAARTTELVHRVAAPVFAPADARAVATDLRPWRGDSGENTAVDARCELVRADVFGGTPGGASADPCWVTPTVWTLGRVMYEARDFSAMPLLADALQAAGCHDAEVLNHCRGGGPHVRGCWVVDRILGKR